MNGIATGVAAGAAVDVGITSVPAGSGGLPPLAVDDHGHVTGDRRHLLGHR